MLEYIPSMEMRNYLKEIGYELSDFEKAALIYNAYGHTEAEILGSLRELADLTKDLAVKRQIQERLCYENRKKEAFHNNEKNDYVYVVCDGNDWNRGFFENSNVAIDYARRCAMEDQERYCVEKNLIVKGDTLPMQKQPGRLNYNLCDLELPETVEYNGHEVSCVTINKEGEIFDIWSNELAKEEELDEFDKTRFENAFIEIPLPPHFTKGHPVRDVITGKYSVIGTSKDSWTSFLERVKNGLYVDFIDMSIKVYSLTKEGLFSHDHVSPIYLETGLPNDLLELSAIDALCTYWSEGETKDLEESVLRKCRDYAEHHRKKCRVEAATSINDILF